MGAQHGTRVESTDSFSASFLCLNYCTDVVAEGSLVAACVVEVALPDCK